MKSLFALSVILLSLQQVPAPVPRCSPYIIINKVVESSNLLSDSNPYFPVPPCEYGSPEAALAAGDKEAVWLLEHPELIPRHNLYELTWFFDKGLNRWRRIYNGEEQLVYDPKILNEGYQHSTPYTRTTAIGIGRERDTSIIDNPNKFNSALQSNIHGAENTFRRTFGGRNK